MKRRLTVDLPIRILQHKNSDFLVALSDKFPGILAHGKDFDELEAELEEVLRYLFAKDGYTLIELAIPDGINEEFIPQTITARAEPRAA